MRGLSIFVGGVLVGLGVQMAIAQSQNRNVINMNHVGIAVPDIEASITYYTDTLGFPEAFRVTTDLSLIHI